MVSSPLGEAGSDVMLSPSDLFAMRSREQSLPQRSHGQKDFILDGSEAQSRKLDVCRKEQWELLGEERVERLGSLAMGVWKPQEGMVELTSPAGKFWQTMGFTSQGKQCLLPEEAVYLLECGSVQVFYKDLPLSVQEAYERLLVHPTRTLSQYQVYSHLKRLGFIVTRFNPSSIQSAYERRLNIRSSVRPCGKRKRSPSPRLEAGLGDREKAADRPAVSGEDRRLDDNLASCSETSGRKQKDPAPRGMRDWRTHGNAANDPKTGLSDLSASAGHNGDAKSENASEYVDLLQTVTTENLPGTFCWDFSKISFPNCAPDHACSVLPAPNATLLPENVIGREVDISPWRHKLNLKPDKMSRREREQCDWERRFKTSVSANPEVQRCTNWRAYKELLQEREQASHKARPPHLWAGGVTPLVTPERGKTTASVLERISLMSPSRLVDGSERLPDLAANVPGIHFDVYQADGSSDFKKSRPGTPYARVCVRSFSEAIPSLRSVKCLASCSGDVPVVFALVDCGEVAFYSFKDFQLPVDVYP